jgi:hypothetical protein
MIKITAKQTHKNGENKEVEVTNPYNLFIKNIRDFVGVNNSENLLDLEFKMLFPQYRLDDTGLSARVLNHWKNSNLLLKNYD